MALSKVQDDTGLPKWKVALAVGGTLAAGYAMYYFIFKQPSEKQEKKKTIPKQTSDETEGLSSPNTEDTAHLVSGIFTDTRGFAYSDVLRGRLYPVPCVSCRSESPSHYVRQVTWSDFLTIIAFHENSFCYGGSFLDCFSDMVC